MKIKPLRFVRKEKNECVILNINETAADIMYGEAEDEVDIHEDHPRIIYSPTRSLAQSGSMMNYMADRTDDGKNMDKLTGAEKASLPIAVAIVEFKGDPLYYWKDLGIKSWPTNLEGIMAVIGKMDEKELEPILRESLKGDLDNNQIKN